MVQHEVPTARSSTPLRSCSSFVDSSGLVMLLVIYVLFVLIPMSRRVAKSETREPVRLAVHHVSLDAARPSV